MKYCINCGKQLEDDAIFCDECGEKQEIVNSEIKGETICENVSNTVSKSKNLFKNRKFKIFVILCATVMLLIIIPAIIRSCYSSKVQENGTLEDTTIDDTYMSDAGVREDVSEEKSQDDLIVGKTKKSAHSIKLNYSYEVKVKNDHDPAWEYWFEFVTTKNHSHYVLAISFTDDDGDYYPGDIDIYTADALIDRNNYAWDQDNIVINLSQNKKYWIKTTGYDSATINVRVIEIPADAGFTRKDATSITLNEEYYKCIEFPNTADWFKFETTENYSSYRFIIDANVNENPIQGRTYLVVYDSNGKQVYEYSFYAKDDGYEYCDGGFFDLGLTSASEYYIKIYNEDYTGDYGFCILENPCEAGMTMNEAFQLEIGTEYYIEKDSTLDDWFVCRFEKGKYKIIIQNIDVGCAINYVYYSGDGSQAECGSIFSDFEDYVKVNNADERYIQISTQDIPNGTYYIYIQKIG